MNYQEIEVEVTVLVSKNVNEWSEDLIIPEIGQDTDLDDLVIKDGDAGLTAGKDYELMKEQDGDTVTVTITFKGSYTGTITKSYRVSDTDSSGGNTPGTHNPDGSNDNGSSDNTSNGSKTNDVNKTASSSDMPPTGDTARAGLWWSVLSLSGGFLALFAKKNRKKKENEDI